MGAAAVALGQQLANKYRIERVLGRGGMGIVFAAWHHGLEQRVAIKVLRQAREELDASVVERFQREARVAARIQSPHVCRVLDTGELDDGTLFLVMEHLEGRDLADELHARRRLESHEAVGYLRQACAGLAAAHAQGVIHRDLKPDNLFLVGEAHSARNLKILDFGVSKALPGPGSQELSLTRTAALVGCPLYMSPEQIRSARDVDVRTDIWSLGCILYEALAGHAPFEGESLPQLIQAVLFAEPQPLARHGVSVPPALEAVLMRALSKSRDERYPSAEAFSQALAPFAAADARPARSDSAGAVDEANLREGAASRARETSGGAARSANQVRRTSVLRRFGIVALTLLAALVVASSLLRRGQAAPRAPATDARANQAVRAAHAVPQGTRGEAPVARPAVAPPPRLELAPSVASPSDEARSPARRPGTPRPGGAHGAAPGAVSDFGGRR